MKGDGGKQYDCAFVGGNNDEVDEDKGGAEVCDGSDDCKEIFFAGGEGVEGAVRFNDFLTSGDEFDFRCFEVTNIVEDDDNSFPILLHACAINTKGFSCLAEY